jgi:hypothetical protein
LPQAKATAFPVKHLDLVTLAITKDKQPFGKRILRQIGFHQNRQTVDALTEVHHISAQINRWQVIGWAHHWTLPAVFNTFARVLVSTLPVKFTTTAFGKRIDQSEETGCFTAEAT